MIEPAESKLLEDVAESISTGVRVDWPAVESQPADDRDTAVLHELHLLDRLAAFHRSDELTSSVQTDPSNVAVHDTPSSQADVALQAWGHFTMLEKIGEGTFAIVYRARNEQLQTDVALKLLKSAASSDPTRALKEARLLAKVRHANVVHVYDANLIDGRIGVWMELIKGRTLANIVRTNGPLSADEAAIIGLDLCRALAAVHSAGLVHGDVKAHNVMREAGGRTVLMDFGTGKDLHADWTDSRGLIDDFAGTPAYLPPEVFEGGRRTRHTDIYSLGVLLFHLVTDSYPVPGRSHQEIEDAHRRGERRHLRDLRSDLPEEFIQTVERAIDPDPNLRYQSAGAFETALLGRSPEPKLNSWFRPVALIVSAAAALLLVGLIYNANWNGSRRTESRSVSAPPAPSTQPAAVNDYQIETAFYRDVVGQPPARLRSGQRVKPGDKIHVEVLTSVPTHVYILNEDERGDSYLLFPLAGQGVTNPLPAGQTIRLPGHDDWYVDKAGGREHFLVLASPTQLADFEQALFASLPRPERGKPVLNPPLRGIKERLRSVGGLASRSDATLGVGPLVQLFHAEPLGDATETAHGLWVRQLTVENPVK